MKTNLLKLSHEVYGPTEMMDRKRFGRSAALCLMQLRSHIQRISTAKPRLSIPVEEWSNGEAPQVVKITHKW